MITQVPRRRRCPPSARRDDAIDDAVDAGDRRAARRSSARRTTTLALQQCALLPVEAGPGGQRYIDATAPFKLAKDPAKAARLDTVLNLIAQAIYRALVGLLPVLPEKAAAGLAQLGVDGRGKTLAELFAEPLPAGPQARRRGGAVPEAGVSGRPSGSIGAAGVTRASGSHRCVYPVPPLETGPRQARRRVQRRRLTRRRPRLGPPLPPSAGRRLASTARR